MAHNPTPYSKAYLILCAVLEGFKYTVLLCCILGLSQQVYALGNPVSRDYVNQKVAKFQSDVQSDVTSGNSSLTAKQTQANTQDATVTSYQTTADNIDAQVAAIPDFPAAYNIGDLLMGGVIVYLEPNGRHGLIASINDNSSSVKWYNTNYSLTYTTNTNIYAGLANTAQLIKALTQDAVGGNFAARVCLDYSTTVGSTNYDNWYLPSVDELTILYNQYLAGNIAGFSNNKYWSSNEVSSTDAYSKHFGTGITNNDSKNNSFRVRCIRRF